MNYIQAHPPDIGYKFVGEYIINNKYSNIHQVTLDETPHFFTTDKDEVVFFTNRKVSYAKGATVEPIGALSPFINNKQNKQIYMSLNPMVNRFAQLPPGSDFTAKSLLNRMGIEIVMIFDDNNTSNAASLEPAKHFLASLRLPSNHVIEIGYINKPEWQAHRFATYDNLNQMLLTRPIIICLTIADFCVSSIELLEEGDDAMFIEIRSKTDAAHQRKYYNTMLRALALMVIPLIWPNAMHMLSYATNPLSIHTMVNRFHARVDDKLFENKTKKQIKKQMPTGQSVPIVIPLSSETIEHAKQIFYQYIK